MVNLTFVFQTYRHKEKNTQVEIYSNQKLLLTTPEIHANTVSVYNIKTSIPATVDLFATGARVCIQKVSINNFAIDTFNLFPKLVNNTSENYRVYLHNNKISFTIDDDNPTRWLMKNKNEILIDRTAEIMQDRIYNYE